MPDTFVGAQTYTIRDFCKTESEIAASFAKLAKCGYRAVQVSGLGVEDARVLRRLLDENGLSCAATHVGGDKFLKNLSWVVDFHKTLNCEHAAIGGMPAEYRSGEGCARFAREFSEIARKLKAEGISFSYHNHSFEFEKFDGRLMLDVLIQESDPEVFMLELDTYWVQHGGGDPAAWIDKVKGRIPLLHLKDMTVRGQKGPIMAEVGEGNLNWPAIMAAARAAGTRWYLVEQDACERDPFESLRISLENLKKMGLS